MQHLSRTKTQQKPEMLCSVIAQEQAIDIALSNNIEESLADILRVAKAIRIELASRKKWTFTGSLSNFSEPPLLSTLVKWLLIGPNQTIEHTHRRASIDRTVSVVTQLIMQSFKTDFQVNYQTTHNSDGDTYQVIETPLSVGLGMYIDHKTRSKQLIDKLYKMKLSVSYDKVSDIKRCIATEVKERAIENQGLYMPSILSPEMPVYFAIDNADLSIDTPDGKSQLHGTAVAVYQLKDENYVPSSLDIRRASRPDSTKYLLYELNYCPVPNRENVKYISFESAVRRNEVDTYKFRDSAYFMLKAMNLFTENDLPTWSAFNSLISEEIPVTTFCLLPLIQGSPTDWSNLYSALRAAEKIRVANCSSGKNNNNSGFTAVLKMYTVASKK